MLTDRIGRALGIAIAVSVVSSISGYALALRWDVSIGGMMAVMTGVFFAAAFLLGPRHGLLAQHLRRRAQRDDVACRTLVMHLHSHHGTHAAAEENTARALHDHLAWSRGKALRAIHQSLDRGMIRREGGLLAPTEKGRAVAQTAEAAVVRDAGGHD
jgi:manganese/zinc/iron transport system permease protein